MRKLLVFLIFQAFSIPLFCQNVNGVLIDATSSVTRNQSAAFEINAITSTGPTVRGGFLMPRVALTGTSDATTISGTEANGLMVYNDGTGGLTPAGFYFWQGGSWNLLATGSGSGLFTGGNGLSWSGTTLNSVWTESGSDIYNNNAGNVGIGTSGPSEKLEVANGSIAISSNTGMLSLKGANGNIWELRPGQNILDGVAIRSVTNTANDRTSFSVESSGGATRFGVTQATGTYARDGFWVGIYDTGILTQDVGMTYSGTNMQLYAGSTEKARLSSSGNFGVGTTNPSEMIHISSTGDANIYIEADSDNSNEDDHPQLILSQDGNLVTGFLGFETDGSDNNNLYLSNNWANSEGDIRFRTQNTNRMTVEGSGNVGIGTTSPSRKLNVDATSDSWSARFQNSSGYIDFGPANTSGAHIYTDRPQFYFNQTITLVDNPSRINAYSSNNLELQTNGTTRVTVLNSNGYVGIGTGSPSAELEVDGWIGRTQHNNGALVGSYNNVAANSAQTNPIYVIGSNYKPNAADLSNMYGIGYTHTNASFITDPGPNSWGMYVASDGDARVWLAASSGGHSYFNTGGNVGIGTTTPGATLEVNGNIKSNAINETSDFRFKKDISTISGALDKVLRMRGVNYNWRTIEFPEKKFENGKQYGLIAQELEEIVPELVVTDAEGWKSVQYSHLVPMLIESIKELAEKDVKQQGAIEVLSQRLSILENNQDLKNTEAELNR